ncbi:MAG: hypothetical protein ABSA09_08580 [Desulfobaccales bacterium]
MGKEKYIKIDASTGKPGYIDKDEAHKEPGMADDDDLCFIKFTDIKIPKAGTDEEGGKKQIDVPGIEFECDPPDKCKEMRKKIDEEIKKLKDQITAQEKIIDDQKTIINDQNKTIHDLEKQKAKNGQMKPAKDKREAAQKEKVKADEKKRKLEADLKKLEGPECSLEFFVAAGEDKKKLEKRLTLDEIKEKKITYVVCLCRKDQPPEQSEKK